MDVPFLLSEVQMRRIEPFFPLSHGVPRVDDRRIVSAIGTVSNFVCGRAVEHYAEVVRPSWTVWRLS